MKSYNPNLAMTELPSQPFEHINNPQRQVEKSMQEYPKSKYSTIPKKMNSMERVLEEKPKGLHKLSMANEKQNISKLIPN